MTAATHVSKHYLVLDALGGRRIFVFLDCDPASGNAGPRAEPVTVELASAAYRFRSCEGIAARPFLGQSPTDPTRFRVFRSALDIVRSGYLPVSHYRVCNDWDDYYNPWGSPHAAAATNASEPSTI